MPEVYIEKTAVSPALRPQCAEEVIRAAEDIVCSSLGGDDQVDILVATSQTFNRHVMPDFIDDVVARSNVGFRTYAHEEVHSNMQPILHEIFDHVAKTKERVLVLGVEALGLIPKEDRPAIIGKGLGPDLQQEMGTMVNAIGFLSRMWAKNLGIDEEHMRERMMEVSLKHYQRSSLAPHSQFFGKKSPSSEDYRGNLGKWMDSSRMLTKFDCAPGDSNQVAAMVISGDESRAQARVLGWETAEDCRPFRNRLGFKSIEDEAVYGAFQSSLKQSGLRRKDLMVNGVAEIHNAFGPLTFMTLHEMGFLSLNEMKKPWEKMDGIDTSRINTNGGLKSGHPLGATALVRFYEALQQMKGTAPKELQVGRADYGLIQSVWGARHKISVTLVGNA